MNIFNALSQGKGKLNEENLSAMFGFLLNPNNEHGLSDLFLKRFLMLLSNKEHNYSTIIEDNYSIDITFESPYDYDGRIRRVDLDLKFFINGDEKLRILIENKIRTGAADKRQFLEEYMGVRSNLIDDGIENTEVIMVFLTHPSQDGRLVSEYDELSEDLLMDGHTKQWIYWDNSDETGTIINELKQILMDESMMIINPISEYIRHTIKAFVCYVKVNMQDSIVKSNKPNPLDNDTLRESRKIISRGKEYQIERYISTAIKVFDIAQDEYVTAKPVLRNIVKDYNMQIPLIRASNGKKRTTREIGRDVIKELDELTKMK